MSYFKHCNCCGRAFGSPYAYIEHIKTLDKGSPGWVYWTTTREREEIDQREKPRD